MIKIEKINWRGTIRVSREGFWGESDNDSRRLVPYFWVDYCGRQKSLDRVVVENLLDHIRQENYYPLAWLNQPDNSVAVYDMHIVIDMSAPVGEILQIKRCKKLRQHPVRKFRYQRNTKHYKKKYLIYSASEDAKGAGWWSNELGWTIRQKAQFFTGFEIRGIPHLGNEDAIWWPLEEPKK